MMMMQVGANANEMSQSVQLGRLVMPPANPQLAFDSNSILSATTPELEQAFINFSARNPMPQHTGYDTHPGVNFAVDGLVRALAEYQKKQDLSGGVVPASMVAASATESTASFSDGASSPSTPDPCEFSPGSPTSTLGDQSTDSFTGMPLSSLEPKAQEELKRQRKKERNRVAAMKCRRRKIEREQDLDGKVKALKTENGDLTAEIVRLRSQVYTLKQTVMDHIGSGCNIFKG